MKIGEFANICNTKISVLRHYDKEGLLNPIYIDRFTGYRYYDKAQAALFVRISEWKQAGFSLAEIRDLLSCIGDADKTQRIFEKKRAELQKTLSYLSELQKNVRGDDEMLNIKPIRENIELPFVNDDAVVGKWEFVGDSLFSKNGFRELYFLPNGEKYWCFSWTKGKLIYDNGSNAFVNDYTLEQHTDGLYMYLHIKFGNYVESGRTEETVLRKADSNRYTKSEIARKDSLSYPFVDDARVIGTWKSVAFLLDKDEFSPLEEDEPLANDLFFKELTFYENGHVDSVYGEKKISGDNMQVWTKGYVLRKFNHTACAYEIRKAYGREYLIIEWKSGDYIFGGRETDYYAFVKVL